MVLLLEAGGNNVENQEADASEAAERVKGRRIMRPYPEKHCETLEDIKELALDEARWMDELFLERERLGQIIEEANDALHKLDRSPFYNVPNWELETKRLIGLEKEASDG